MIKLDTTTLLTAPNRLQLLLPPSVNDLRFTRHNSQQQVLKDEGYNFIYIYSLKVKGMLKKIGHVAIDQLTYFDLDWYLPNKKCDSHNYEKALFDMLEKAGVVSNDKYIMNRTQSVSYDKDNPRVIITWLIQ